MLIFIFQSFIYPLAEKIVRLTPLRKMVAGGFIAAIAFFVSGIVQLRINVKKFYLNFLFKGRWENFLNLNTRKINFNQTKSKKIKVAW